LTLPHFGQPEGDVRAPAGDAVAGCCLGEMVSGCSRRSRFCRL